jgi:adenylyltransferase/sulfurtransferase
MAIRLLIPTPLRPFTAQQAVVLAEGATVGELLRKVTADYAELRPHLYRDDGRLRNFVNVYVNDEDIRQLDGGTRECGDGHNSIVPSVAGGHRSHAGARQKGASCAQQRRSASIQPASDHAGGRCRGQRKLRPRRCSASVERTQSPAALYPPRRRRHARWVDFDVVDVNNLRRQIPRDATTSVIQLASAQRRLPPNPDVNVVEHETLTSANLLEIVRQYDFVVDGADNFPRYL